MFDLKNLIRGDVDAHEQLTTTTIGCRTEGEETIHVAPAMPWYSTELHSAEEMSMGGSELEPDHSFGGWETHE